MSLVNVNWHPSQRDLRGFRWIALALLPLIGLILFLVKQVDWRWCTAVAAVGGGIWLSGLISTKLTRVLYLTLVTLTLPIGLVISFTMMAVFYFGVLTPLGLFFRVMGRDALCRRLDDQAQTYWCAHESSKTAERYFQQF